VAGTFARKVAGTFAGKVPGTFCSLFVRATPRSLRDSTWCEGEDSNRTEDRLYMKTAGVTAGRFADEGEV